MAHTDNSNGAWLPGFQDASTENTCPYVDHTKGYGWATTDCTSDRKSSLCEEGCKQIRSSGQSVLTVALTRSSTFTFYVKPTVNGLWWKLFLWAHDFQERYQIRMFGEQISLARISLGVLDMTNTFPYNVFSLEAEEFHKFWVRLADGKVSIGRGGDLQPLVELADPEPLQGPPWYLAIRNEPGYEIDWKFCDLVPGYCNAAGDDCRRRYRDDCTDGITYYSCPRNEPDSIASPSCQSSPQSLGMETREIEDNQIEASTSNDIAPNARLNSKPKPEPPPQMIIFPAPRSISNYAKMSPAVVRDLSMFTLCLHMHTDLSSSSPKGGLVSYAVGSVQYANELLLYSEVNGFHLWVDNQKAITADLPVWDGGWHAICATWRGTDGRWQLYADGVLGDSGVGLSVGGAVDSGGTWILGQDQDAVEGGFDVSQAFIGELSQVNLWDRVLSADEIGTDSSVTCGHHGNVIDWTATSVRDFGLVSRDRHLQCGQTDVLTSVALGRTSTQSSTAYGALASRATDGNTDSNFGAGSCTHTSVDDIDPWWQVDLEAQFPIKKVVIFNRVIAPERINPFYLHIGDSIIVRSNPKCGGEHRFPETWPRSIDIWCDGMRGRYVGVQLYGTNERQLTLCEVQVFTDIATGGGWMPPTWYIQDNGDFWNGVDSYDIWIGVRLSTAKLIIGILTQGADDEHYVTSYKMSYSDDGNVFEFYERDCEEKIFYGNTDGHTIAKNILEQPVTALAVRLHPLTWHRSKDPGLRFDFLTCQGQGRG
ncbi:uncharacterized protein [Branchiostoma lanceolatum]|uniref:uncharacterized protein n=1 Tax=Branchiostoma lanceolatum TaxID=7740 RepID=UPI00345490D1